MTNKLKITAVSYLNTKPLLYGILQSELADQIELELNIPSVCAQKLRDQEVDLALVPVAIIPELQQPRIVSDYCIGTVGAVKTVGIYSERPIEELEVLYLDFHSRTSVELAQILVREHWKKDMHYVQAGNDYLDKIEGTTGAVLIGDKTIGLEERFPYFYDLGQAWMDFSGLPFVFAAWVSNKPLDDDFVALFNKALQAGVAKIPELMFLMPNPDSASFDLQEYYTRYISYELDTEKRKALTLFLKYLSKNLQPSLEKSLAV